MSWAAAFLAMATAVSMTTAEEAAVQRALDRGTVMFYYDQAAWHGTDEFMVKARDRMASSGGWIVDGPASAPEIIFFDKDLKTPHAIFVADFVGDKIVSSRVVEGTPDATLTASRLQMIGALRTARAAIHKAGLVPCTNAPFNTIVMPPSGAGAPTTVYFLSAQTETQTIPFGGHYAVEVSADGTASAPRPFTKACLNMTPESGKDQPAALVVTHILGSTPTEIHAFSMLAAKTPVYVGTSKAMWSLDAPSGRPRVRLLARDEGKAAR